MAKHGHNHPLWPYILGLIAAGLALAAFIALLVINPGKHTIYPPCQYGAMNVTVVVEPPKDCTAIMGQVADDADFAWTFAKHVHGEEFAQLGKGKDTLFIYESGNRPLAGKLADHFMAAGWRVELPTSPSPSPLGLFMVG